MSSLLDTPFSTEASCERLPSQAVPDVPAHTVSATSDTSDKGAVVQSMFNRIAGTYDLLNDCLTFGQHRLWKRLACRMLQIEPGHQVLDVCTGTGDLVSLLSRWVGPKGQVTGLDFSEEMLAIAQKRFANRSNVRFQQGDAMALPFETDTFDGAVVAFGLRNVSDVTTVLSEMTRVVKPGGWVVNLDTCKETDTLWPVGKLARVYFSQVMPILGRLLSKDANAYEYLSRSTEGFMTPAQLVACFSQVGLIEVSAHPLGFGLISLQAGQKPF